MFSLCVPRTPRPSLSIGLLPLFLSLVVTACADAPPLPTEGANEGGDLLTFGAQFGFTSGESQEQMGALGSAFDQVNSFHLVLNRVPGGEVAADVMVQVTPGQGQYSLAVAVTLFRPDESFTAHLSALRDGTLLFEAVPFVVHAPSETGPAAPVGVTLTYAGPGVGATGVRLEPEVTVLGPGSSVEMLAQVVGPGGTTIQGVPLAWSSTAPAVSSISPAGLLTGLGSGVAEIFFTTPTGLRASAMVYVVSGELAYVRGGHVVVATVPGGSEVDLTPGAVGADAPSFSRDGQRLFYVQAGSIFEAGKGEALVQGDWPALSPDGRKLALEGGNGIAFANADGSHLTPGPAGAQPQWKDRTTLIVGGGSIEKVRADGSERTVLSSSGGATLPALSPLSGRIAYLSDGNADGRNALMVMGPNGEGPRELVPETEGVRSRPSWDPSESWVVAEAADGSGLLLAPVSGEAPAVLLPGSEGASAPVWRTSGTGEIAPVLFLTSMAPPFPRPGEEVEILGGGFDWVIPSNTVVFFPGLTEPIQGEVLGVKEERIVVRVPGSVTPGTLKVVSQAQEATLPFSPAPGELSILVYKPPMKVMAGAEVTIFLGPLPITSGVTDESGLAIFSHLDMGSYQVRVTPPDGFSVEGANPFPVSVTAGLDSSFQVRLRPEIRSVTLDPEGLEVVVGEAVSLTVDLRDVDGDPVSPVGHQLLLSAGSPHLEVRGTGLQGIAEGIYPSSTRGGASILVVLDNVFHAFPTTVTSSISGVVTDENDRPLSGVQVGLSTQGPYSAHDMTDQNGSYAFQRLLADAYTVNLTPAMGYASLPPVKNIDLGSETPVGTADFRIVEMAPLSVCSGDLIIEVPADLTAFSSEPCGRVTGNLIIRQGDGPDLTNLDGLETIQVVDGDLRFAWSLSALSDMSGLAALKEVGGHVLGSTVFDGLTLNLPSLETVGGDVYFVESSFGSFLMPRLSYVGTEFFLNGNLIIGSIVIGSSLPLDVAVNLRLQANWGNFTFDAPRLASVDGYISVENNAGLISFAATSSSTEVIIGGVVDFSQNSGLTSIDLTNVVQVMEFDIYDNPVMQAVNMPALRFLTTSSCHLVRNGTPGAPLTYDFPLLERVGTNLELTGPGGDLGAQSFPSLTTIPHYLWVRQLNGLNSISFPLLTGISYGEVVSNPDLLTFAMPNLEDTGEGLLIQSNGALIDFDLVSVRGDVDIGFNASLPSLPPMPSLGSSSRLYIQNNASLTTLGGLTGVTQLQRLVVGGNHSLTDLSGLSTLAQAPWVDFSDNDGLTALVLPSLTQATTFLRAEYNSALTQVSAPALTTAGDINLRENPVQTSASFPVLTTVTGQIYIYQTGLPNLNGLSALTSPVGSVFLAENPNLVNVSGLDGIGDTFASPAVSGNFNILNHPALCAEDVDALIAVIAAKNPLGSAFAVAPVNSGQPFCGLVPNP